MRRRNVILLFAASAIVFLAASQITIFVVQPIGALPNGATVVMLRGGGMNFIDSADGWCERHGGMTLMCRGMLFAGLSGNSILLRLPYSERLYSISTGGRQYAQ